MTVNVRPCSFVVAVTDGAIISCPEYAHLGGSGVPLCSHHGRELDALERVYVLLMGNYVKIGYSADVARRMAQIMYGATLRPDDAVGTPLLLMAALGGKPVEALLHRLLSEYQAKGEWFRREGLVEDMVQYLASISDAVHAVEVSVDQAAEELDLPDYPSPAVDPTGIRF